MSDPFFHQNTSTLHRWRWRLAYLVAAVGMAFHGFIAMTSFDGKLKNEYGAGLVLVATLLAGPSLWRPLWRQPFFRWALLFIGYVLLQCGWIAAHSSNSITFSQQISTAAEPVRVGMLASFLGLWLAREKRWIVPTLALMFVGYLSMLVIHGGAALSLDALHTLPRLRLQYSENIGGLFAGELLVILTAAWLHLRAHHQRPLPILTLAWWQAGILVLALIAFACLLLAQSRGAWLAGLIGVLVVSIGTLRQRRPVARPKSRRRQAATIIAIVAAVGVLLPLILRVAAQRLHGMDEILHPLLAHGVEAVPNTSVGLRLHLYMLGIHTFMQHPWLGVGLRSIFTIIVNSGIREAEYIPPHLHDSYLQILVGLGLIGTAILGLSFVGLCRRAWRSYRTGRFPLSWFWLVTGWFVVLLIDITMDNHIWRFPYLRTTLELLLALLMAFSMSDDTAATAASVEE